MDNFQIQTAQNVSITKHVAGLGERIAAYLIDLLIIGAYLILASLSLASVDGGAGEQWVYLLILGLPVLLYFLLWESLWDGKSPGKAALGIRVVMMDGSKPGLYHYLVRWLLRIIDIGLTSGSVAVVTILINGKGQRLGDVAAGTTVVNENKRIRLRDTLLFDLSEGYLPRYPQVTLLSDQKVQEISSIFREAVRDSNFKILNRLAEKVSQLLEVSPEQRPVQFLETVLKDYRYYTEK